jgi:hypothetical protein
MRPSRFLLPLTVVTGLAIALATPAAAATTVRVSDAQLQACTPTPAPPACKLLVGNGTAAVVDTASSAVGHSYLRLSTPAASDKATVYGVALSGGPLSAITSIGYRTLIETPGTGNNQIAPSINIEINPHKAGSTYATLVWEPTYTGPNAVATGVWQTWSPSTTPTGSGGWWSTRALPLSTGQPNLFGFNSYTASFADVKAALPDATVLGISVNQGSGSTGLVAGVDRLMVNGTTYDFENPPTPTGLVAVSGDGQRARPGTAFARPLSARLTPAASGAPVTFTVTSGSASFPGGTTATATTGPTGVATSPVLTAGATAGPVVVTATAGALSTTFRLEVAPPPGPPLADLALTIAGLPASAPVGSQLNLVLTVHNNGPATATQLKTVFVGGYGLAMTTPDGFVANGVAVFTSPTLASGASTSYTLHATVTAAGPKRLVVKAKAAEKDPNDLNNLALPTLG